MFYTDIAHKKFRDQRFNDNIFVICNRMGRLFP